MEGSCGVMWSERVDFFTHKASTVGERRHWLATKTSAIWLQVILGHKNALLNSISSDCNLANTLRAASWRKKERNKSCSCPRALQPLSWCVGGKKKKKKAAEEKVGRRWLGPNHRWNSWLLLFMLFQALKLRFSSSKWMRSWLHAVKFTKFLQLASTQDGAKT